MSVIIEAYSVIARVESIANNYIGSIEAYFNDLPNSTFCSDGILCRVGFMRMEDAHFYASELMSKGLHKAPIGEPNSDIAYASQVGGLVYECEWILVREFVLNDNNDFVLCASLGGAEERGLAVPEDWTYEQYNSFSHHQQDDIVELTKDANSALFEATISDTPDKRYIGIPNIRKSNEPLN